MKNRQSLVLYGIFLISGISFLHILWFFNIHRYLPPPFFFNSNDTFMDFYHTLYWSGHDGIYDIWGSVYPPLNFLLLKIYRFIFLDDGLHNSNGFEIRNAEWSTIVPLVFINIISVIISVIICYKNILEPSKQFIVFLIILISPAFLFAVERGNLIILCIPLLSWYVFSKSQIKRAIALSLLVNLKPYFAIFYAVQLLSKDSNKDNKDLLFLLPILSLLTFLTSGLILNQEFYLMPINLLGFASKTSIISPPEALSLPSTVIAFSYLRGLVSEFGISPFLGYAIKIILYTYLIKILILIYKRKINFEDMTVFSIIFLTNYSMNTGGYGLLFYIPVIPLLYKNKDWTLFFIIIVGMYIGIWDLIPIYKYNDVSSYVYLSEKIIKRELYLNLGSIVRPIANFAILVIFLKYLRKKYQYETI